MFRTARITFAERGRDAQTDIFRVFDNPKDTDPHRLIKEVAIALHDGGFRDFRIIEWSWAD
jgi:hypothetical protein